MHSSVYYYLVQVGALTFSSDSLSTGGAIQWGGGGINLRNDDVAYFMGARVIVDDMPTPINMEPAVSIPASCWRLRRRCDQRRCSKNCALKLTQHSVEAGRDVRDHHYGMHIMGTS